MKRPILIISLLLCALACGAQGSEGVATAILEGRTVIKEAPKLATPGTIDGIVVVSIDVDASGAVISATSGAEGTTISNQSVLNATRTSALKALFNAEAAATGIQKGTITFRFTSFDYPQTKESVLKFLGIPIDGSIESIKKALEAKGFKAINNGLMSGQFDGEPITLGFTANHGKVNRVALRFDKRISKESVRIKYNTLLSRFNRNAKYSSVFIQEEETDNGLYRKNYDAIYFYLHPKVVPDTWIQDFQAEYRHHYSRALTTLKYEELEEILFSMPTRISAAVCGIVWFTIDEWDSLYLYYVNIKNRPRGEDL